MDTRLDLELKTDLETRLSVPDMMDMTVTRPSAPETVRVGNRQIPWDWMTGVANETAKSFKRRLASGFFDRFCSGDVVLDIGWNSAAYGTTPKPLFPHAIGIDAETLGYNGIILPYEANSVDVVYSSHVFEHLQLYALNLLEWYRVTRLGGHIVIVLPHKFLYERKDRPPSLWNNDHYRFYTPASLLTTVEEVLSPNCYRIRHLADNDQDYRYEDPPNTLPAGAYEIELVIQKIAKPRWGILL